jgi:hypothetical protein
MNEIVEMPRRGRRFLARSLSAGIALAVVSVPNGPVSAAAAPASSSAERRLAERLELARLPHQRLEVSRSPDGGIVLPLDLDGRRVTLRLARSPVRAASFRLLVPEPDGTLREVRAPEPRTYRGAIDELPGSSAAGGVQDGALSLAIRLDDGAVWVVEPAPGAARALHVVHRATSDGVTGSCPVDEAPVPVGPPGEAPQAPTGIREAEIAFDADFEFFNANGNSLEGTVDDIETLMAAINVVYERDCGLTHRIVTMIVRTMEPDPYTSTSPSTLLSQFRTWWNGGMAGIVRDVAHLMTGKDLDGGTIGFASVGVVCDRSRAYGLSQSRFAVNFNHRLVLTAHELGHNWNSGHCDAVDPCYIMCSSDGGCDGFGMPGFEPYGMNAITSFASSRNCLDTPVMAVARIPVSDLQLLAPRPSPSVGDVQLRWYVDRAGPVRLEVFDVAGQRVAGLVDGDRSAGWHSSVWNGLDRSGALLPPGVYHARLECGGQAIARRVILVR